MMHGVVPCDAGFASEVLRNRTASSLIGGNVGSEKGHIRAVTVCAYCLPDSAIIAPVHAIKQRIVFVNCAHNEAFRE